MSLMKLHADISGSLVEFAPDAMLVVDADGVIVYANKQVADLFGCSREEILGRNVECLLPERFRARHVQHRRDFAENERLRPMGVGLELYGRRWDGVEFPVEISLSPLQDSAKGLTAAAIRDVTDRKRAERELIAAREAADVARDAADRAREAAVRANQGKSRFLATASHDLRQPLQALAMLNGTLRRMRLGERAEEALLQQTQAIDAMGRLLNALLDISKLESGAIKPQPSDFALAALFDELRGEFSDTAAEKGLALEVESTALFVHSDPSLLEQVLRNLISNAIKYTQKGRVRLGAALREGFVRLEVADTGIGIPRDQIPFIFDEFFQVGVATNTTRDGYGLGLSIVQRILKLLRLRMDVQSTVGRGSVFAVELPLAAPQLEGAVDTPSTAERNLPKAGAARVLLVEDHPGVLKATELLLALEGYTVVSSLSRAEAMEHIAEDPNVDLLITDYHLSGAETGVEVISAVRSALQRDLPVVLVTGDTSAAVRKLRSDPTLRLASKPINADELLTVMEELLQQPLSPAATSN
jgi:two-component system, sensor histidine kinase